MGKRLFRKQNGGTIRHIFRYNQSLWLDIDLVQWDALNNELIGYFVRCRHPMLFWECHCWSIISHTVQLWLLFKNAIYSFVWILLLSSTTSLQSWGGSLWATRFRWLVWQCCESTASFTWLCSSWTRHWPRRLVPLAASSWVHHSPFCPGPIRASPGPPGFPITQAGNGICKPPTVCRIR